MAASCPGSNGPPLAVLGGFALGGACLAGLISLGQRRPARAFAPGPAALGPGAGGATG